jgi:hypothetical protein
MSREKDWQDGGETNGFDKEEDMGTVIGLIFVLILLGVLWWAIVNKLYPLIAPYIGEPFNTIIYVLIIFLFVFIVLWAIAQLLSMAGVHVPLFSGMGWR